VNRAKLPRVGHARGTGSEGMTGGFRTSPRASLVLVVFIIVITESG